MILSELIKMFDLQEIPEYKTTILKNFNKTDWDYLEKPCFGHRNKKLFEIYIDKKGRNCIDNTSAAGVIQLTDNRLYFKTKVYTQLLYMLKFLKSEKDFLFDTDIINVEVGDNFFDIIARLFQKELKKIIRGRLLQKYKKKQENRDDLKGDLDIEEQIQNDINDIFKFSCVYHELTVDNLENRIVLKATHSLKNLVRFDKNLKNDLDMYEYIMKKNIKLVNISSKDCDMVRFDISNEHYVSIIRLSKIILKKNFIKSINEGKSVGFNFIVDMNIVFQDFITDMIKDVIKSEFPDFIAKDQKTFLSFIRGGRERPDIGLKLKNIDSYPIIIELKYKKREKVKHADKVQVGAYSIAPIPGAKVGCIICAKPNDKEYEEKTYDYVRQSMMKNRIMEEKPLLIYTVDLYINENLSFDDFIKKIKDRIKYIISDLIHEIYIQNL